MCSTAALTVKFDMVTDGFRRSLYAQKGPRRLWRRMRDLMIPEKGLDVWLCSECQGSWR